MTASQVEARRLIISKEFQKDFARLEKSVQDKVRALPRKFATPELVGTHVEPVNNAAHPRFRTVRVDRSVRAVVLAPERGNTYTLIKVLPHDDAYKWVERTRMDVSRIDGSVDFWEPPVFGSVPEEVARSEALFGSFADEDLTDLGVTAEVIEYARTLRSTEDLDRAQKWMPPSQWQVLSSLASGQQIDEVRARLAADAMSSPELESDQDDLDAAIARSVDQFHVVSDEEDFNRILDYPFDVWRNYLHPSQLALVNADYDDPARISGGPGTGKTVVCVHRAHRLAQRKDGFVLLTTYNKTLARQMERNVDLLVEDAEVRRRIKVRTVDSFARSVFEHYHGRLASDRFMARPANLWQRISNDLNLDFTGRFLHEEHVEVILAQAITSEEEYLRARRSGRGKPIGTSQRKLIWRAVTRFNELMATQGWWTFETILHEAARVMPEIAKKDPGYRYIIVDEAQDLTPDHWRLIAAAMANQSNGLFISGDAQQTIYRRQTSMRAFGINVVGRSTRLHKNHRVSAEILRWAHDFVRAGGDATLPELDAEIGFDDDGAPDTASFSGFAPVTRGFDDTSGELDYVVETVRGWTEAMGYAANEIGVLARSHEQVKTVREALRDSGVAVRALGDLRREGVAVGTMHSAKGLEFRCVAVVGVSDDQVPPSGSVTSQADDAATHRADVERERKLLFVACTRAREDLLVTWTGLPSRFINPAVRDEFTR